MSAVQYTEKFIAFLDVLGWKSLVRASDKGCDLSLGELCEIMDNLGNPADREHFEKYGPRTCPQAPYMRKDMDFCITRLSDSALISAEVSPAGLINLVSYCFRAYTGLLSRGVMCRGYIKPKFLITPLSSIINRESPGTFELEQRGRLGQSLDAIRFSNRH